MREGGLISLEKEFTLEVKRAANRRSEKSTICGQVEERMSKKPGFALCLH